MIYIFSQHYFIIGCLILVYCFMDSHNLKFLTSNAPFLIFICSDCIDSPLSQYSFLSGSTLFTTDYFILNWTIYRIFYQLGDCLVLRWYCIIVAYLWIVYSRRFINEWWCWTSIYVGSYHRQNCYQIHHHYLTDGKQITYLVTCASLLP